MILCGDIGGTHTRLSLIDDVAAGNPALTEIRRYENHEFTSLPQLLKTYLQESSAVVSAVSLSVAGPVIKGRCQMTNIPWLLDVEQLRLELDLAEVVLVNDLAATALAVPHMPESDFHSLQTGLLKLENGPIAVISVGTGLGESVLLWDNGLHRYRSLGGEGGHKDFGPHTDEEMALYAFLKRRYPGEHISTERLISGHGLTLLYQFLCERNKRPCEQLPQAKEIGENAVSGKDSLAQQAVLLLFDLLASEASNTALQYLSTGGLVIAGGIPPKLLPLLSNARFLRRFHDKGRFTDWLSNIAIVVCKNEDAPMLGAWQHIQDTLLVN